MSFYGKIYQQLGNVFNRLTFKSKIHSEDEAVPTGENNEIILTAEFQGDNMSLSAGNGWIVFKKDEGNGCEIYHGAPSSDSVYKDSTIEAIDEDPSKTIIDFGDKITLKTPTFDKAGHFSGYSSQDYVLAEIPPSPVWQLLTNQ